MFGTVRTRFLNNLDPTNIKDLDDLNQRFFRWLEDDYKRKAHRGLAGLSPHDVFMSQVSNLKLVTDKGRINECFLLRVTRKIQHDATTQIMNVLYETDSRFVGKRVEIRYEPDWLDDISKALPIYSDGKKIGEAKMVRFQDNAHAKRKFRHNRSKNLSKKNPYNNFESTQESMENTISYSEMMGGE